MFFRQQNTCSISFSSTRRGFESFYYWIQSLMTEHQKTEVIVGLEPTGHYWLTLAAFLRNRKISIVVVNPMHVKKSKELDDNSPTKNDPKDARVIAQLVKDGRYSVPYFPNGVYAELREAVKIRDDISCEIQRIQGNIHNWLDRYFPEFLEVFASWEDKAALETLKHFPLPQDIIEAGSSVILSVWQNKMKRGLRPVRAVELVEQARHSIGLHEGAKMAQLELKTLLMSYELKEQLLNQVMKESEELLAHIPGVQEILTIPGMGITTVAGFFAEVGDLSRYRHPRQLQKLSRLSLKENRSGKYRGKTQITKRGRPRLRTLLYRVIRPMVLVNSAFQALHTYYTTRQENPLRK
ncbi:IS110 family transposase [Aneurinibacillus thermoaerophilus]|uniref:IS110 family transposase n=1 Tax=Aneurinibacillus thermoaerophilus TaxID=143495 RepID=UPI002E1CFCDA|nr:IS110 family transposase [Aneurinibacillus thermoaerophilus]MED0759362.1 IS110 family transposase [Aneurinibacillus thermoaerophilus]